MIDLTGKTEVSSNALTMRLGEGATAHNMGEGFVAIDQRDETTKTMQRVVIARADLENMLAWTA